MYACDPQQATYVPQSTNGFVYDGWNLAVRLASDLGPLASFTWGADMSGTLQGAGGVGGLLSVTVHTGPNTGACFCCYDGNGNVMGLINAADGSVAARYEYGPFGELLRATGPLAKINPIRWSTKYQDDETDLVMYLRRPYNPSTGRFLARDPIEEHGGRNLYGFVLNSPPNYIDRLGGDYYITTAPGFCGIKHRYMVGDDGNGGHYVIDLAPNVERWYQQWRRVCGEGIVNVRRGLGSASNATGSYDTVERTVSTSSDKDKELAAAAGSLDGQKITYCLVLRDCRDIDRCVKTRNFVIKAAKEIADVFKKYEIHIGSH